MKLKNKYKKTIQRIVSFTAAVAMVLTSTPMNEVSKEAGDLFSAYLYARAEGELDALIANYSANTYTFESKDNRFVEYSQCFADPTFAEDHKNDVLTFISAGEIFECNGGYASIGTENSPFSGTIYFNTTNYMFSIKSEVPLFNCVSDNVKLYQLDTTSTVGLVFNRSSNVPSGERRPLFANSVKGTEGNTTAANWNIALDSASGKSYSGVIGSLVNNARVNLTFTDNSSTSSPHSTNNVIDDGSRIDNSKGNTNVGILCGDILDGSVLTASYVHTGDIYICGTQASYTGGLVGNIYGENSTFELTSSTLPKMIFETNKDHAGLICGHTENGKVIIPDDLTVNGEVKGNYAGGLIGFCKDTVIQLGTSGDSSVTLSACTIDGSTDAGAIFGYYESTDFDNDSILNSSYTISNCEIKGGVAGGIAGEYANNYAATTLDVSKFTFTNNSRISAGTVGGGVIGKYTAGGDLSVTSTASDNIFTPPTSSISFGGVIGEYTSLDLKNTLSVNNIDVNGLFCTASDGVGGIVRNITNSSYLEVENVSVTNANAGNASYFGGIVSYLDNGNAGSFVDVTGDFTLSLVSGKTYKGGAIAGSFKNGVIRLAGITDISGAKAANGYAQLVYENDNTLVYAKGSGSDENWTLIRNADTTASDIGQWGEVVRLVDGNDMETAGIVTLGTGDDLHKVTLAKSTDSVSGTADLVKLALNMQLNDGTDHGALCFEQGGKTKSELLSSDLTLSGTADLSGTGILSLMRDGGNEKYLDGGNNTFYNVEFFTGSVTGSNNAEVKLAAGELYGTYPEGSSGTGGKIYLSENYGHDAQGLFAFASGASISNLKISGDINVERNEGSNYLYAGALFGAMTNGAALSGVTITTKIDTTRANNARFYIGGVSGVFDGNDSTGAFALSISGSSKINPQIVLRGDISSTDSYNDGTLSNCNNTYTGGVLGLLKGANETRYSVSVSGSEVSPKITLDDNVTNVNDQYCGGMIGRVRENIKNERAIEIDTVTMTNAEIQFRSKYSGGLLGTLWDRTQVTINGLTVTGSKVENKYSNDNNKLSGLVYRATGKWDVNSLSVSNTRFSTDGSKPESFGLIVNEGYRDNDGLYLNLKNSGYTLTNITVPTSSNTNYFVDEIVADTKNNSKDSGDILVGGNGTAIISINMNTAGGTNTKVSDTGTYQNRITSLLNDKLIANQNSRYYYNLDEMLSKGTKGSSAPGGEKFLLWSVRMYAAGNIKGYFKDNDDMISETSIDLSGLSYYPINISGVTMPNNAVITLDYSGINAKEDTTSPDGWDRDPLHNGKPKTAEARNQHYLMQTGLFHNVGSFTAKALTVQGDFGYAEGVASGALINGQITGTLTLTGLTLKGLAPSNSDSALIVNHVNGEGTNISNITLSTVIATGYSATNTQAVATSLFGSAKGQNLTMSFSDIKLDARDGDDITDSKWTSSDAATAMDRAYGTTRSIFSNATLFNSLLSTAKCDLVYNYTVEEDWGESGATTLPRSVTYGKEISDSKQYVGGEQHYNIVGDGTGRFTNPVSNSDSPFDFKAGFLPYVANYEAKGQNNDFPITEIKVNYKEPGITVGCGTYNDPYVISTPDQLETVAGIINGTKNPNNLKLPNVFYQDNVSTSWHTEENGDGIYNLNGDNYNKASNNTKGVSGWNKTRVRKYFASAYYQINNDIELTSAFEGIGQPYDSDNTVRGNTVFHGVIVGNGSTAPKITNPTDKPFIVVSNGSVIKNLQIENTANISITQDETGSNALYGYNSSKAQYYGGVIGEIMGGDNIIDDVKVTYSGTTTLDGSAKHLIAEGGMVGAVVNGALIFRGLNTVSGRNVTGGGIYSNPYVGRVINGYAVYEQISGKTGTAPDNTNADNNVYYHIDTIVRKDTDKLDVNYGDSTVTVPDAQALYIMSLITQSIASTAKTSGNEEYDKYSPSYGYNTDTSNNSRDKYLTGIARLGDYTDVGCGTSAVKPADYASYASLDSVNNFTNSSAKDGLLKAPVPYIIYRYTTRRGTTATNPAADFPARKMTYDNNKFWDITLSKSDTFASMDSFQAFRGIGSVGINAYTQENIASKTAFKVASFNGGNNIIKVHISLPRYRRDNENYFHKQNKSLTQTYDGNDLHDADYGNDNQLWQLMGLGLFDCVLVHNDTNHPYQFYDIRLQGTIEDKVYDTDGTDITGKPTQTGSNKHQTQLFCVGGVVGKRVNYGSKTNQAYDTNNNFSNIIFDGLTISGAYSCGGLIGIDATKSARQMKISGCNSTTNGINVTGGYYGYNTGRRHGVGSFVGMTFWCRPYIDGKTATSSTSEILVSSVTSFYEGSEDRSVVGGLIGYTGSGAEIKNIVLKGIGSNPTIGSRYVSNAAGFVGFSQAMTQTGPTSTNYKDEAVFIDNCTLDNISVKALNSAAGFLARCGNATSTWYPKYIEISNCAVIGRGNNKPEIRTYGTGQDARYGVGGFIADFSINSNTNVNATPSLTSVIENSYIKDYKIEGSNVGGIVGAVDQKPLYLRNLYVKDCDIITTLSSNSNYGNIGGMIGRSTRNLSGYNLKIDEVNFYRRSGEILTDVTTTDAGIIVGRNSTSLVDKFVAIGAYHSTGSKIPTVVIKTNGTNSSNFFVFADYLNASSTDIKNKSGNKSTFNADNNVEQPKAPYVNVNPRIAVGTDEFITSDGAGAGVAGEIYAEAIKETDRSNRAYTKWTDIKDPHSGNKTDKVILSKYINTNGTYKNGVFRISDFETEFAGVEGIENVDNFAMLVVNNDADLAEDITPFIKSYIRMVTNTDKKTNESYGGTLADNSQEKTLYSVVIRPCTYNSETGKFKLGTAGEQGLKVETTGSDNGKYKVSTAPDSTKENQFSLIDIQFKDPTDTSANPKMAYHLYVPVLTVKTMSVNYYSASVSGTSYLPSTYTNRINSELAENKIQTNLVESTGAWTTTFIRYEYPKNEVRSIYAWNHSKKLTLKIDSNFNDLPAGTKLILVDPNNNKDAAYTYTFESAVSKETDFSLSLSDFVDESGDHFKEQNLNTLLSNQSGQRGNDNIVYENYYISMYIPKIEGQTHLVRFESQSPLDVDVAAGEEKPVNAAKASVEQKLVTYVVAGDLYTHTIEQLSVDSNLHSTEMTSANNTLTIYAQAKIILNDPNAGAYLANSEILQSFYISLTSYESDASISDYIKGIVQTDITSSGTAEYTNGTGTQNDTFSPVVKLGGNYVEIKTGDIKHMLLNGDHTATISTTTNMEFYDVTAFPYKTPEQIENATSNIGSVVGIKSNIAYDSVDLPYSPITAKNKTGVSNPDTKYYYTTTQNFADLSFNAVPTDDAEDEIGYKTNNRSLLGINGKYGASPQLAAKSVYNVSRIVDYDFASDIQYTVKLWNKTLGDDGITRYVQVNNISEYLTNVELTDSEVELENISTSQNEYIYKGRINHNNPKDQDKKFEADFKCRVKTSDTSKREYANYKIEVTAELINATNTKRMDYIVYTNALIDPEVIPGN